MNLKERVQSGVDGKFEGLSIGFPRLSDYIFGLQKSCYMLLGGLSGCFKSTITDFILLNAIQDAEAKGVELNIHYYSFEIDELTKKCNWLSNVIFNKYNRVISPETIKGYGKNKLTKEEQALVNSEIDYVDSLFKRINFIYRSTNPTGIYKHLMDYASTKGTFEYYEYSNEENVVCKGIKGYKQNNPLAYNLVVMDHIFLLKKERGFGAKEVIDKMSEFFVVLRNLCGYSFIVLQQFNQGLNSIERQKFKNVDISPSQGDFRDSTVSYTDAHIVIRLMKPISMDMSS